MFKKTWWTLLGFLLLWMMPGARNATTASAASLQGASQPKCIVTVNPMCENEPGRQITFTFVMMNGFDQTRYFVLTVDMDAARRFTLLPNETQIHTVQITVDTPTFRLHPKAWSRIFNENELTPAEQFRQSVQLEVDKITQYRTTHAGTRTGIANLETRLEKAVRQKNEGTVQSTKTTLDTRETNNEKTLNKIKTAQDAIVALYAKQPEADAFITRLTLVGFNTDFKRITDAQEENPGIMGFANTDDDNDNNIPDKDEQNVQDEDDLYRMWWYFARPVDSPPGMTVTSTSPRLNFWKNKEKTQVGTLPTAFSGRFQRDGVFVQALEASVSQTGEPFDMLWAACQDKANVKIAEVNLLDATAMKADHVQIARWDNANGGSKINPKIKDTFIQEDPEKFFTQVKDPDPPDPTKATVRIKTLKKDKTDHNPEVVFEIDVKALPVFEMPTKPQMLMSDKVDDEFKKADDTGKVNDDAKNDRTYIAECEGIVRVKYKLKDNTEREFDFPICDPEPKEIREIKIHFIFPSTDGTILTGEPYIDNPQDDEWTVGEPFFDLNGNGTRDAHLSQAEALALVDIYVKRLNELYAQACIRIIVTGTDFPEAPGIVMDGNVETTATAKNAFNQLTPAEQAIFSAGMNSGVENDLEVYFWRRIRNTGQAVGGLGGKAMASDFYKQMPNTGDLNDSVFLNSANWYYTLGHEMGHVLRHRSGHAPASTRMLLYSDYLSAVLKDEEKTVEDSKRLLKEWADAIRTTKGPHNQKEYAETP